MQEGSTARCGELHCTWPAFFNSAILENPKNRAVCSVSVVPKLESVLMRLCLYAKYWRIPKLDAIPSRTGCPPSLGTEVVDMILLHNLESHQLYSWE